jgi:hypothetical protein
MDLAQKSLIEIEMNIRVLGIKDPPLENKVENYAHEQYLFLKKV